MQILNHWSKVKNLSDWQHHNDRGTISTNHIQPGAFKLRQIQPGQTSRMVHKDYGCSVNTSTRFYFDTLLLRHAFTSTRFYFDTLLLQNVITSTITVEVMMSLETSLLWLTLNSMHWLMHWLIDSCIDSYWLMHWLTHWLMHWLTHWLMLWLMQQSPCLETGKPGFCGSPLASPELSLASH